jgi:hypothetical protein
MPRRSRTAERPRRAGLPPRDRGVSDRSGLGQVGVAHLTAHDARLESERVTKNNERRGAKATCGAPNAKWCIGIVRVVGTPGPTRAGSQTGYSGSACRPHAVSGPASPLSPRQLRQRRCCSQSQPARSGSRAPRRPRLHRAWGFVKVVMAVGHPRGREKANRGVSSVITSRRRLARRAGAADR